jgi:uncharacterized C2H2 Zn-finger protein
MPQHLRCPECGALCRRVRDRSTGKLRCIAVQEKTLLRRLRRLEDAMDRLRAAVKAEHARPPGRPPRR